jgi:lysophospholipase L1-like esterase
MRRPHHETLDKSSPFPKDADVNIAIARLSSTAAFVMAFTIATHNAPSQDLGKNFLDAPPASSSTTVPTAVRDGYWNSEFERVNKEVAQAKGSHLVFFGDSITLAWTMGKAEGKTVWDQHFAKYRPINMGNSGDITPVMLYRTMNGNLDFAAGQAPRVAVLLCGTNNYVVKQSDGGKEKWALGIDTPPGEVADGIRAVAQAFRRKLPTTRVIVLGILPVKDPKKWEKCRETNRMLASYNYPKDEVMFLNLEDRFLGADGSIKPALFTDGTHLTTAGYAIMADALVPQIEKWMALGPLTK